MRSFWGLLLGLMLTVGTVVTPRVHGSPNRDAVCYVVVSENPYIGGVYRCTADFDGWGVYTRHNYPGVENAPYLCWEGTNWAFRNGIDGYHDHNIGSGDEPTGSATTTIRRYSVETVAGGRPAGAIGATRDPIDTVNGAMFIDETDIVLPAAGFELAWRRTYNSMNAAVEGPLGPGWSHNHNWRVTETTLVAVVMDYTNSHAGMVLNTGGDAALNLVQEGTNRSWSSTRGVLRTVTGTSEGYELVLPGGVTCRFGTNGLVTRIVNQWGNGLMFTYTNVPGGPHVAEITHSDGRSMKLGYACNRLTRVDSPSTNLFVCYSYNDAGELTNAIRHTAAGEFETAYAYDTTGATRRHTLVTRVNAKGETATYLYQTNASGETTSACIGMSMTSNYYAHAITFSATDGVTTVAYARDTVAPTFTYDYNPAADSRCVTRIVGAESTGVAHRLDYDARTLLVTNEEWELRRQYLATVVASLGINTGQVIHPDRLAIDSLHRLYVAEHDLNRVQMYDPVSRVWTAWGQYGTNVGNLDGPFGIAVDSQFNIYVADSNNDRIQKRAASNGQWTAIALCGTNAWEVTSPFDLALDTEDNLYVTDLALDRVQRRKASDGSWSIVIGPGTTNGVVRTPWSVSFAGTNVMYVSDNGHAPYEDGYRVQKFDMSGKWIDTLGTGAATNGDFQNPMGVAPVADFMYVANYGKSRIVYGNKANWQTFISSNIVYRPQDVVYDPQGILYVADTYHSRILGVALLPGATVGTNGQANVTWYDRDVAQATVRRQFDSQFHLTNIAFGYLCGPMDAWAFSWNTNWDVLASVTDSEGHRTEWNYTNGLVGVERFFPVAGLPVETRYSYASNGLLTAVTNANGHWVRFQRDAYGYPTSVIPQTGPAHWMTWDNLGNLKEMRLPSTEFTTNDPSEMVPRVIAFDPDELGRVRKITWPDESFEKFSFDAIGNVTNHVDAAGRTNRFAWLPTRKLASVTRFLTGASNQAVTIGMAYDQQMNVVKVSDELGRAVEVYQLDLQDRPVKVTNVESQEMAVAYGLGDMVSLLVRFDGSSVTFGYDEGARLNGLAYPDTTLAFRYLKNGLLITASNSVGVMSNAYDGANRLVQTQGAGPAVQSSTVAYRLDAVGSPTNTQVPGLGYEVRRAFDAGERISALAAGVVGATFTYNSVNGLLASMTYTNGIVCGYGYDERDRLTSMTWRDASNNILKVQGYSYTLSGMISRVDMGSGAGVEYTYDSLDRLTSERRTVSYGQTLSHELYEYDLSGNRTKKTLLDAVGSALLTVNYTLGTGNRLVSWSVVETDLVGRVDVAGVSSETIGTNDRYGWLYVSNLTSGTSIKPYASGTNFWAYDLTVGLGTQKVVAAIRDEAGNTTRVTNEVLLTVVTNGTYRYSAAGCLTNIACRGKDYTGALGLTWDGQYQLTAVTTNGTVAERHGYDALGRRVWTWGAEAGTNWVVYDGPHVIAEVNASGALKKSYVYGPGIDNILSMTAYGATTNTYYYLKDHLNSVLALVDEAGRLIEQYRYDAWGRTTIFDADGNPLAASAVGNRYCWQGREYSWKTGLYCFRARWYDPITGRWLSNDPIGISGGLNQYVFCANNPVNLTDPYGLFQLGVFVRGLAGATVSGIGMAVGGAAAATGVGTAPGVALALYSSYGFGANVGNIVNSFRDAGSSPTGPIGTATVLATDSRTARNIAEAADLAIPLALSSGAVPQWGRLPTAPYGAPGTLAGTLQRVPGDPSVIYPWLRGFQYGDAALWDYDAWRWTWSPDGADSCK